jgi:hypothetical protein
VAKSELRQHKQVCDAELGLGKLIFKGNGTAMDRAVDILYSIAEKSLNSASSSSSNSETSKSIQLK